MRKIYIIFGLMAITTLSGCSDQKDEQGQGFVPTDAQKERAESRCEKFVLDNVGDYGDESRIFDTFAKNGKIVVEVGRREGKAWRSSKDTAYSVRLCIYDEEGGTIQMPSVFNEAEWRR